MRETTYVVPRHECVGSNPTRSGHRLRILDDLMNSFRWTVTSLILFVFSLEVVLYIFVEQKKPYGCLSFLFDCFMISITGGLWLIWIFIREMRSR